MKLFLVLALLVATITSALAGGIMLLHVGSADGSGGVAPNGKILLVDGTSFILQTDAVSKICRAGGC